MRSNEWRVALGLGLLLVVAQACEFSVSTANLSSLKVSKDKAASQEASSFAANDTIYAVATVSNAPGKTKVKGRLLADDVEGLTKGPIPGLETTVDLPGSGTATFTFTPPPDGWTKGKYKIEATMLDENGQQKDQKTTDFSVN
jgi:hypothetical protein